MYIFFLFVYIFMLVEEYIIDLNSKIFRNQYVSNNAY